MWHSGSFLQGEEKDSDASGIHKATKNTPAFGTRVPERTFCVLRFGRAKLMIVPIKGYLLFFCRCFVFHHKGSVIQARKPDFCDRSPSCPEWKDSGLPHYMDPSENSSCGDIHTEGGIHSAQQHIRQARVCSNLLGVDKESCNRLEQSESGLGGSFKGQHSNWLNQYTT